MPQQNDYTEYDYDALIKHITQLYSGKAGWGEGYESSMGKMLTELFADTTDSLLYMLERRVQEAFLSTAILENSIYAHASELGYRPRRTICMTGSVDLALKDGSSTGPTKTALGDITIPIYTTLTLSGSSAQFVTTEETIIPSGSSTANIPIKEGTYESIYIDPNDAAFVDGDVQIEDYRDIDEYSIDVYVGGRLWYDVRTTENEQNRYDNLSFAPPNAPVYDIKYGREGLRIVFGDDVRGKKPDLPIEIRLIRTKGEKNSIVKSGVEFKFNFETLHDNTGTQPLTEYYYSIINDGHISGYLPTESVAQVARNAPLFARANKRGVTAKDYHYLVVTSGIGGIVDARAYGEQELGTLIFHMNNVYVSYITEAGVPLNAAQEKQLRNYLDKYKIITTHPVVQEVDKLYAAVTIQFRRNPQNPFDTATMYEILKTAVELYFEVGQDTIGKDFYHSDLVSYVQEYVYIKTGIRYDVTRFVKIQTKVMYKLPKNPKSFNSNIYLDAAYTPTTGDVFKLLLNTDTFTYTVQAGDTKHDIMEGMRQDIVSNGSFSYITGLNPDDSIRISSVFVDSSFSIDTSQGDLSTYITTDKLLFIPYSKIANETPNNMMVVGSAKIVKTDGTVMYLDNGTGEMIDQIGSDDLDLDYKTLMMDDPSFLGTDDYWFVYEQDEYQNLSSSSRGAILLYPFPATLQDATAYDPSSISFVEE